MSTILQKQFEFSQSIAKLMLYAAQLGYHVTVGEALRTAEQAQWNAQHGTGIVGSVHCQKLAMDLNLFTGEGEYITDDRGHRDLGAWWKGLGPDYCWGGDFDRKDFDHYSITPDGVHK